MTSQRTQFTIDQYLEMLSRAASAGTLPIGWIFSADQAPAEFELPSDALEVDVDQLGSELAASLVHQGVLSGQLVFVRGRLDDQFIKQITPMLCHRPSSSGTRPGPVARLVFLQNQPPTRIFNQTVTSVCRITNERGHK